jgi:hypothetical protein
MADVDTMKIKTSLAARRKLAKQYEQKLERQKELLAEYAASCRYHGRPVPPDLGEVLGVVEQRIRNFQQLKKILLETTSGIGVQPIIDRFLKESAEESAVVATFLKRNRAA